MNRELIQKELQMIQAAPFTDKTDKQLWSYQKMSDVYKVERGNRQPEHLKRFNSITNRKCKLSIKQVKEMRLKYNPHVYGKKKLAKKYGVSVSVVHRIIKGLSWKNVAEDTPGYISQTKNSSVKV